MSQTAGIATSAANPLTDLGPLQQRFWQHLFAEPASSTESMPGINQVGAVSQLAIDRQAEQQRQAARLAEQQEHLKFQQHLTKHFEKDLQDRLAQIHQDPRNPIQAAQVALLDEVLSPNMSRNKALLMLDGLPTLGTALVRHVNRALQKRDGGNVTTPKLAFNYIGAEQVQQALPWLQFQLWRPQGRSSLRQRKLWRMVQSQKRFAGELARQHGVNQGLAESLAVLQGIDAMLLLHVAERSFEELQQLWLERAREAREKRIHQAVLEMRLPAQPLMQLWQQPHLWGYRSMANHLNPINKRLLAEMSQRDYHKLSAVTKVVAHAHLNSLSQTLKKRKLADPIELAQWRHRYPKL